MTTETLPAIIAPEWTVAEALEALNGLIVRRIELEEQLSRTVRAGLAVGDLMDVIARLARAEHKLRTALNVPRP